MAGDLTYTLKATVRRNAADAVFASGEAANLKSITVTKSVTARTANDTLKVIRMPAIARISGLSTIYWDDLHAGAGSPTMDVGIAPVNDRAGTYTADPDALNDGIDIKTAAGSAALIKDHANYGKTLWELFGLTTPPEPGQMLDIYVSFVDNATDTTGDVTLDLLYTLD